MEERAVVAVRAVAACACAMLLTECGGGNTESRVRETGAPTSTGTKVLEAGSRALQSAGPVKGLDIYLNGFHPMSDNAGMQMEAHHYCHQLNEDFAQCVL